MWFLHNPGLLGINARNLLYIKAYNPQKAIIFADSKLKTKQFLSTRGIPVAKLYAVIRNKKELENFQWEATTKPFVIKPNSGYGGEGIVVIESKEGQQWISSEDTPISQKELQRHIHDILDGRYSISELTDYTLIEQKLETPEILAKISYRGLPDIRIIVHNLIPVMAMLRLPTRVSHGKANLHLGGIGVGIDIAKGELTHIAQYNQIIHEIPGFGNVKGLKIPYWKELLLIASQVQQLTNLGFAAVDLTLDKKVGPVLLEINARAGLSVQVANLAPLRRRLERIEGIKVNTPEKGIRIAQDIFGEKIEKKEGIHLMKTLIGNFERIELIGDKKTKKIMAKIDPHAPKSIVDKKIATFTGLNISGKCKFNLKDKRITTVVERADLGQESFQMIVGQRDLNNFWIDLKRPHKNLRSKEKNISMPGILHSFSEEEILEIDNEIVSIDNQLHLLAQLKPINLQQECDRFAIDHSYNPQFEYNDLSFDPEVLFTKLKRLEFPDTPLGTLFHEKTNEIRKKINLLQSRGSEEFTTRSNLLIPSPDENLYQEALKEIQQMPTPFPEEKSVLSAQKAKKLFEDFLEKANLSHWSVKLKDELVADVMANKEKTIFIRSGATFSLDRIRGAIAHEIETHAFTAMNGSRQYYKIFQRGLGDYLTTEEGLAIYNQDRIQTTPLPKKYWPASSILGIVIALKGSFAEVVNTLKAHEFSSERALRVAIKTKRGLRDTSKPGAFTKDAVYFRGKKLILSFLQNNGDLRDLYLGKINLEALPLVKKIPGIKPPLYLPDYLKPQ